LKLDLYLFCRYLVARGHVMLFLTDDDYLALPSGRGGNEIRSRQTAQEAASHPTTPFSIQLERFPPIGPNAGYRIGKGTFAEAHRDRLGEDGPRRPARRS